MLTAVVLLPTPPFWFATAMIRARRGPGAEAPAIAGVVFGALRDAFEGRCAAVVGAPEALVARLDTDFGLEDELAAREEEGFVTDES